MDPQRKTKPFDGQIWFSKHSKKEEDMKSVNTEKEIVIKIYRLTWEKMSRGFTRREKKKKKKKKRKIGNEKDLIKPPKKIKSLEISETTHTSGILLG